MHDTYMERPFDFKGCCFTLAIKSGGSEIPHIDFNDNPHGFAILVVLGQFDGADLALPQLGITIPIKHGQVLLINACLLVHYMTALLDGKRYIITGFTDRFLAKQMRDWLKRAGVELVDLCYT